jgi:hypothetical protein
VSSRKQIFDDLCFTDFRSFNSWKPHPRLITFQS